MAGCDLLLAGVSPATLGAGVATDSLVSRRHAELQVAPEGNGDMILTDPGSVRPFARRSLAPHLDQREREAERWRARV
jgi:hypothetical protein